MKCQVIGIQQKKGEYNGYAYDNTLLHVISRKNSVTGQAAESIKFKTAFMGNILSDNDLIVPTDLIGRMVDISFDQYGTPEELTVLGDASAKPATK